MIHLIDLEKVTGTCKNRARDEKTISGYLSKVKRIGDLLENNFHLLKTEMFCENDPFIRSEDGVIQYYSNTKMRILKLPMNLKTFSNLCGLLTIDTSLPRVAKKRKIEEIDETQTDMIPIQSINQSSPSKDSPTITVGCLGGYKSAIKWFHKFAGDENIQKEVFVFNPELDFEFQEIIKGYKRDVGDKKLRGIIIITSN